MLILGVDPGSRNTGYGVVLKEGNRLQHIVYGEIKPRKEEKFSGTLIEIYERLSGVIGRTKPQAIALENIFYGKNVRSLVMQAQVRGVVILSGAEKYANFRIFSSEIKSCRWLRQSGKRQVQAMVRAILKLLFCLRQTRNALAAAICHANFFKETSLLNDRHDQRQDRL